MAISVSVLGKGLGINGLHLRLVITSFYRAALEDNPEKKDKREEKQKDYHLSERRYGSFQRSFGVPDGVDADNIEAHFKNGVLTVTLPKRPEAQKSEKKIAINKA